MDNVTHSLLAGALARTSLGRRSPLSGVALVVAANVPDLDSVVGLFGGLPAYLVHHRGITHALPGLAAQALLLILFFSWLERLRERRRGGELVRAGPAAAVVAGLASHLALDSLNVYGVRPFLPFDGAWRYGDLAFIVDPWLWLILGAPAVLCGARSRRGDVLWGLLGLATSLAVVLAPHLSAHEPPLAVRIGFPLGVIALAAARARGLLRGRAGLGLALSAALFALYGAVILAGRAWAEARASELVESIAPAAPRVASVPRLGDPFRWTVIHAEPERWHAVDLARGEEPRVRTVERGLGSAVLRAIEGSAEARAWRIFARAPYLTVERKADGAAVRLLDLRYVEPDGSSWCELRLQLDDPPPPPAGRSAGGSGEGLRDR